MAFPAPTSGASAWHITVDKRDRANLKEVLDPKLYEKEVDWLSNRLAQRVKKRAKQIVPVRTGRLKRSITVIKLPPQSGRGIVAMTPYAKFVHDGTRYMRARPFFKQAYQDVNRNMQEDVRISARRMEKRFEGSLSDYADASFLKGL